MDDGIVAQQISLIAYWEPQRKLQMFLPTFQIEAMYKKAHTSIRADPAPKKGEKKPFKGKR